MRPSFRRFLTAALLLIAVLCGAAVLAGQMATSLAINAWMGIAGLLLATHGLGHVASRRQGWQAPPDARGEAQDARTGTPRRGAW